MEPEAAFINATLARPATSHTHTFSLTHTHAEPHAGAMRHSLRFRAERRTHARRGTQVVEPFALQLAAHKAVAAAAAGRTTTRTLHSDVVFHLSPTNNVRIARTYTHARTRSWLARRRALCSGR
jgi:hypothetical protein